MKMYSLAYWEPTNIKDKRPGVYCDGILVNEYLEELAVECLPYGVSISTYKDGYRKIENVEECNWLAFDFDKGTSHESILESLDYNHIILASKNHLRDKNDGLGVVERFHLFIPLSTPINCNQFYKFIQREVGKSFPVDSYDVAVADISRFYAPHREVLSVVSNLPCLDVFKYEAAFHEEEVRIHLSTKLKNLKKKLIPRSEQNISNIEKSKWFKEKIVPQLSSDGTKYYAMRNVCSFLKKEGYNKQDASELVMRHVPKQNKKDWPELIDKFWNWLENIDKQTVER